MCVPADAELPDLGLDGPLTRGAITVLPTQDGAEFATYTVEAPQPNGTGILLIPDVRGLFPFYERLAEAFASQGFTTVAMDFYGREMGTERRPDDWDPWPVLEQKTADQMHDDAEVAAEHLRTQGVAKVVTVGFCLGGSLSLREGIGRGRDGVAVLYGSPAERGIWPSAFDRVDDFDCPVLGLFGGADQGIPTEVIDEFDEALTKAGKPHEFTTYDGAPHSFFDRHYGEWADASRDAWQRILAFAARV
jgi:carboxymethylenebutenolidase